jgi:hypothetical protein
MRQLPSKAPHKPNPSDVRDLTKSFGIPAIDLEQLCQEMQKAQTQHEFTRKAFAGWTSIPLRSLHGTTGKSASGAAGPHASTDPNEFADTPIEAKYTRELINKVSEGGGGVLKARIMRLEAGANIGEHRDRFKKVREDDRVLRFHIPLKTNPRVEFIVNDKSHKLSVGRLYLIDVGQPHRVVNRGKDDRIHLVFDVLAAPDICNRLKL